MSVLPVTLPSTVTVVGFVNTRAELVAIWKLTDVASVLALMVALIVAAVLAMSEAVAVTTIGALGVVKLIISDSSDPILNE